MGSLQSFASFLLHFTKFLAKCFHYDILYFS